MSPAATETIVPVTALVLPLLVGLVLTIGGAASLGAHGRATAAALPWLRVATGVVLLVSSGAVFTIAALGAVALCVAALVAALDAFGRDSDLGAARLAGAAALLTVAVVTAIEGLLGVGGIAEHLARFELRDLSWAAALVGVLAVCSLLQLGATRPRRRAASAAADRVEDGAPQAL
ncbi:hypothetical protein [Rathayibacter sp. VKM Ac-2754]|uniref:hypothetical protein n=1 Tax=Rathayibacter sp. VKM Ac-2754 TaxID=2609251 RepID=UPI001358C940|nr:hypothetical protein [Rathayibacter sp. VKM Ac-2754]MWV58772.1 hypothetical protein [Rathayibacter sp. VKM Ac-2754]